MIVSIDIRESFDILDTDGDGFLYQSQVERLMMQIDPDMTEEEMKDLLEAGDLDGNKPPYSHIRQIR